mgnify:CR=1 FL=1
MTYMTAPEHLADPAPPLLQWTRRIRGPYSPVPTLSLRRLALTRLPQRLRPLSYAKSHVILIAFALDTPDSLENVSVKWNEEVRSICEIGRAHV